MTPSRARAKTPDTREEMHLLRAGHTHVAGLDEAGRGAWAGPVCAAAVVLPLQQRGLRETLRGVRDSKLLSAAQRETQYAAITRVAVAIGVGWATPPEVDQMGIVAATRHAMARAVEDLDEQADALVIDHLHLPALDLPQRVFPKADARCLSVAAASIIAKVSRDRLMVGLDDDYPGYGLARHKGYGTRQHRQALSQLGPTKIHRMSWQPFRALRTAEEQPHEEP